MFIEVKNAKKQYGKGEAAVYALDAGEISVDGQDVTRLNKKELTTYRKESIGLVFQFYNL